MLLHFPFLFALQDFSQQPPAQELIARDLHDVEWKFRHIFRGRFEVLFINGICQIKEEEDPFIDVTL
jgi:hypothetical protein